jgi:hypothetical protein
MGIVRRVEWALVVPADEASERVRNALGALGLEPEGEASMIRAKAARSLRKNRWAAEVAIEVQPLEGGSMALCSVDMAGNKHYAMLSEIAEAIGDDAFDDRGATEAIERLGKMGRVFGRKEVRHLRHLLRATERVITLGQGTYDKKQGLVVLTNERLFFFEKSLGSETVEEFWLKSISSMQASKKLGGERLVIHASGNQSEIKQMLHGQAEEISRQFRTLMHAPSGPAGQPPQPIAHPADDPMAQLERLASLRDKGVIDAAEFEEKKAEFAQANLRRTGSDLRGPRSGLRHVSTRCCPRNRIKSASDLLVAEL